MTEEKRRLIAEMSDGKRRLREIADAAGVSVATAYRAVKDLGLPMRAPGRPRKDEHGFCGSMRREKAQSWAAFARRVAAGETPEWPA